MSSTPSAFERYYTRGAVLLVTALATIGYVALPFIFGYLSTYWVPLPIAIVIGVATAVLFWPACYFMLRSVPKMSKVPSTDDG